MNDAIKAMLKAYGPIRNSNDEINALREIVQRVTLLGLHRGGFFQRASFYGGTALRLLFDLDRFSEDMDFCLVEQDPKFQFTPYFESIAAEMKRFGLSVRLEEKRTGPSVTIESAFVKQNTYSGLLVIGRDNSRIPKGQLVKVRLEVDKANPPGGLVCRKLLKLPIPYMIATLTEDSLFAGKLHAILARSYLNRVKGRDFYDFLFYSARGTKVNLRYLEAKLRDSGHYAEQEPLELSAFVSMLKTKITQVNFAQAKEDVLPFIRSERVRDLEEWSADLFIAIADTLEAAV